MDDLKAFFSVVVIGIDDKERFLDQISRRKNRLTGSPRFFSTFRNRKTFREIIHLLVRILDRSDLLDPVSDDLLKIFLQIFSDDKNNFIKTRFQSVMDRIVHNDLAARTNRGKLLDSAAKTASNSCCHDDKRCLFHVTVLLFSADSFTLIWRYHNTDSDSFQSDKESGCTLLRNS